MNKTMPRAPWSKALLVAVEDKLAARCTTILRALDLEVGQAAGPNDAGERIVTLQPAMVIVPASKKTAWGAALEERASAAGTELVWISEKADSTALMEALTGAAIRAMERAAKPPADQ